MAAASNPRIRDLYGNKGLSARRIAEVLQLTRRQVEQALRAAGVMIAPRGAGRTRTATSHGVPDLDDLSIRIRPLYERDGLSIRQIADSLGLDRRRVSRVLRAAGVAVAPRGAGRARPLRRLTDPDHLGEQLRALYEDDRLPRQQVADKLGISEGVVRRRLADHGIAMRTRGQCSREDRREAPKAEVVTLYQARGLSARQVADRLGVSGRIILRTAHDHGIPVRPGASTTGAVGPIALVAALYEDPAVQSTLARHGLPIVAADGPIWHRFPVPVPLTTELCVDLYVDCGASLAQIELLTGQPAGTVRRKLQRADVALRPAGGRSPLRLRWEQRQRRSVTLPVDRGTG